MEEHSRATPLALPLKCLLANLVARHCPAGWPCVKGSQALALWCWQLLFSLESEVQGHGSPLPESWSLYISVLHYFQNPAKKCWFIHPKSLSIVPVKCPVCGNSSTSLPQPAYTAPVKGLPASRHLPCMAEVPCHVPSKCPLSALQKSHWQRTSVVFIYIIYRPPPVRLQVAYNQNVTGKKDKTTHNIKKIK